ncbi:MAG: DUF4349 domain-containing protein [Pseudomonas sp.]
MSRMVLALLALFTLAGCSDKGSDSAGAAQMKGERNPPGSFLAYEHNVAIELPAEQVLTRLSEARDGCSSGRFGECSLLNADENSGQHPYSSLTVRIVPEGVEKLVTFAANGGELISRNTRSEDLAQSVSDNRQQREQLHMQQQTLRQYQARKDLSVSDMLALAKELAAVEVQLQASAQEAAQQQRRINTNLLTLSFSSREQSNRLGQIGDTFTGMLDNITEGTIAALEFIGYGLPFLVLLFPAALLVRWLWHTLTRRKAIR